MRVYKHKNIEYSEVNLFELGQEMRFDADYWEPSALRNEDYIKRQNHKLTKAIAPNPQYGISIAMNEDAIGFPILKMDNIMDFLAEDNGAKYADISDKTFRQFELKKYDVLFNRVNSDEFVGRTGIYLLDGKHTFASYLVRVDSGKDYTNCYLTAFLNCKYGKTSLQRVKRRAVNQANINAKELSNLTIPYPSDELQKLIKKNITEAQQQKELSDKLYKEAEEILLEELGLLHWKPKTKKFKLQGVQFEVEDTINEVNTLQVLSSDRVDSEYWLPKYEEFNNKLLINKHIEFNPLASYFTWAKGIEVGSKEYVEESKYPFIRVSNISKNGFNFQSAKYIHEETYKKLKPFHLRKGEILFSKDGTAGIALLVREKIEAITSSGILRLTNISNLPSEYFELVLNSQIVQIQIAQKISGALIHHLKVTEAMKFIIPEIKSIARVAELVNKSNHNKVSSTTNINNAINAVELFIEEGEAAAVKFIKQKSN